MIGLRTLRASAVRTGFAVLGVIGSVATASPAFAATGVPNPQQVIAYLDQATLAHSSVSAVDQFGNVLPTTVRASTARLLVSGKVMYATTLAVGVLDAGATRAASVQPSLATPDSACGVDGSISVEACATMYFNVKNDSAEYFLDAEYYHVTWTRLDSNARLLNGKVSPGAIGRTCTGGFISTGDTFNQSSPTSGTAYSFTPHWHGTYVSQNSSLSAGQKVNTALTWAHGTQQLTLNVNERPGDDEGWQKVGGCA